MSGGSKNLIRIIVLMLIIAPIFFIYYKSYGVEKSALTKYKIYDSDENKQYVFSTSVAVDSFGTELRIYFLDYSFADKFFRASISLRNSEKSIENICYFIELKDSKGNIIEPYDNGEYVIDLSRKRVKNTYNFLNHDYLRKQLPKRVFENIRIKYDIDGVTYTFEENFKLKRVNYASFWEVIFLSV